MSESKESKVDVNELTYASVSDILPYAGSDIGEFDADSTKRDDYETYTANMYSYSGYENPDDNDGQDYDCYQEASEYGYGAYNSVDLADDAQYETVDSSPCKEKVNCLGDAVAALQEPDRDWNSEFQAVSKLSRCQQRCQCRK